MAPATEYVPMPEGSSSATPVIRPGPILRNDFRFFVGSSRLFSRFFRSVTERGSCNGVCAYAGRVIIRNPGNQARANPEKRFSFLCRMFSALLLSILDVCMVLSNTLSNRYFICCLHYIAKLRSKRFFLIHVGFS